MFEGDARLPPLRRPYACSNDQRVEPGEPEGQAGLKEGTQVRRGFREAGYMISGTTHLAKRKGNGRMTGGANTRAPA
jgi:hypothetical protein